jgi:hypothetical protein
VIVPGKPKEKKDSRGNVTELLGTRIQEEEIFCPRKTGSQFPENPSTPVVYPRCPIVSMRALWVCVVVPLSLASIC